jgi:Peptidase family M28
MKAVQLGSADAGARKSTMARMRGLGSSVLLLAALSACGSDDEDGDGSDDGTTADDGDDGADGGPDAGAADCPLAGGCPDWLEDYASEVIASLTGERAIDGRTLPARYLLEERELARTYLAGELARHGLDPEIHEYGSGANVFAELPATGEGGRLVVLGAHFDTVPGAPGAADDASGVALVLAAARYLSALERRDWTVVFVLFDEEEVGLIGSQAFAEKLLFEAVPLEGMHNFDMLSWDGDGDRGVELWAPAPELEDLYRGAAEDLDLPVESFPDFLSSDHGAFVGNGFAAIGLGEEYHAQDTTPHYHQPTDTLDKIDLGYLASCTRLGLLAVERQLGAGRARSAGR